MRRVSWRGLLICGLVAVGLCALSAGAYAYFVDSGSDSSSADLSMLQPVTVTALVGGDTPSSALLPGSSADVVLRVSNPNPQPVTLLSVTGAGSITPDAGHPGCTTSGVTFTDQTGLSMTIPASGTTLVHLAGAASMSAASSNGCQGATFSIPVSISVREG